MNMNIIYRLTRVSVLILSTALHTVLTRALPTAPPSTATDNSVLDEGITSAFYNNVTAGGNSKGAPCVFPFYYNGAHYEVCVNFEDRKSWCSTTDNYNRDGQWRECLHSDICQHYNNISDPWRNIGCDPYYLGRQEQTDRYLQEGWYHFTGLGGDRMAHPYFYAEVDEKFYDLKIIDCGGGLILYYLVPIDGVYLTNHSSCTESSCSPNGHCDPSDGRCVYAYDKDDYTCTGIRVTMQPPLDYDNEHDTDETNGDITEEIYIENSDDNSIDQQPDYSVTHIVTHNNVTAGGNSKGAPCVFPFYYNGAHYEVCVNFEDRKSWCSTTDNYNRDGQWRECLDSDVCQHYNNISDPWRNIGCDPYYLGRQEQTDRYLQEGWYHFTGLGGDRMAHPYFYAEVDEKFYDLKIIDCGGGLILYYLVPIDGVYLTNHSSCTESSCSPNGHCDPSDGRCVYAYDKDDYTCTGIRLTMQPPLDYNNEHDTDETNGDITEEIYIENSDDNSIDQQPDYSVTHIVTHTTFPTPSTQDGNHDTHNGTENTTDKKPGSSVTTIVKHNDTAYQNAIKKCLEWKQWVNGSCSIIPIDRNRSKCYCVKQLETNQGFTGEHLDILMVVVMPVGLMFLSLTLLTFVFRRREMNVNNIVQVNLCLNLLVTHLIFLFKEALIKYIQPVACAVVAGCLHFFYLSSFVWMFIDAILLFISAKNLTKIRSQQKEVLGWKWLTVIGYIIPLTVVGVSVAVMPKGYGSKQCGLKSIRGFKWSLLGPIYFILASNVILFITIFIAVTFSLKSLNSEILQQNQTVADRKLIRTVLFKTMAQFFILGCPWLLGLINSSSIVLEIVYLILISQQGTVIFLVHCVLNKEIRQQYRRWFNMFWPYKKPTLINNV